VPLAQVRFKFLNQPGSYLILEASFTIRRGDRAKAPSRIMQIQRICSAPLRFEDGRAHSAPKLAADPLHATALLLLCIENP